MIAISRDVIEAMDGNLEKVQNLSLLYDKFILPKDYGTDTATQKEQAFQSFLQQPVWPTYQKDTFHRLDLLRKTYGDNLLLVFGQLKSRLAINLADGLIENAGMSLDRHTGVPFIPGSAVKGCCAHAAYWMQKEGHLNQPTADLIFGQTTNKEGSQKGLFTFYPAFPWDNLSLNLDILTPHQGENPIPNKFPVIEKGTIFAFPIILKDYRSNKNTGSDINLLSLLKAILLQTFENGMGAKTAAGLGWFSEDSTSLQKFEEERQTLETQRANERERIEAERRQILQKQQEEERKQKIAEEQEERRLENERKREEEEKKKQKERNAMNTEDRLVLAFSEMSKTDFEAKIKSLPTLIQTEQKALLQAFKGKNPKKQKQFLKDKKLRNHLETAARELQFDL